MPGAPSGADMRFVKREWARYESMLGAINDPTSLEAAVAKRAHKRLAEIAAEVKLSNTNVVELANQVRHAALDAANCFPSEHETSLASPLNGAARVYRPKGSSSIVRGTSSPLML